MSTPPWNAGPQQGPKQGTGQPLGWGQPPSQQLGPLLQPSPPRRKWGGTVFLIGCVVAVIVMIIGVALMEQGRTADTPIASATSVGSTPEPPPASPKATPSVSTPPQPTPPQLSPPETTPPAPPEVKPSEFPTLGHEHLPAEIGDWVLLPPKDGNTGGTYAILDGGKRTALIMVDSAGPTMEVATRWLDNPAEGPVPGTVCGLEVGMLTSCFLQTESLGVLTAFTADGGDPIPDLAMVLQTIATSNP